MLGTPFEHAARAPVRARTRPRLLKSPRVQDSAMQSVLACRSQLVSSAQRDRSPLEQIWFDTVFQYIIYLILFFSIILEKAENYICFKKQY